MALSSRGLGNAGAGYDRSAMAAVDLTGLECGLGDAAGSDRSAMALSSRGLGNAGASCDRSAMALARRRLSRTRQ